MPEFAKDVVIALLGASVGLAGLLLLFSGFVFTEAASFPAEIPDEITRKYRRVGKFGLLPFLLSLVVAALCVFWFAFPTDSLYCATVFLFLMLLLMTLLFGFWVLLRYL